MAALPVPQRRRRYPQPPANDFPADLLHQVAGCRVAERRRVGLRDVPQRGEALVALLSELVFIDSDGDFVLHGLTLLQHQSSKSPPARRFMSTDRRAAR